MESESVHYKNFAALLLFNTILKQLNFKWTYARYEKENDDKN